MNKPVIIIGAGGHGKVIADIVICSGDVLLGFLDDDPAKTSHAGFPVLGRPSDAPNWQDSYFVIAVGNAEERERIALNMPWAKWYSAIHPTAVISGQGTVIGEGAMIGAGAVISPGVTVGDHCIINTGAIVEHDSVLEDYVHVSVKAATGGFCHIGKGSWVGIGATLNNGVSVCSGCMLGAGCVVLKDIDKPGVYVGVPIRKLR